MVKKRTTSSGDIKQKIADFGNQADRIEQELSPSAPRGKKRGGNDRLISINAFEDDLITRAAKKDDRSILGFIRLAAVEQAKKTLNE